MKKRILALVAVRLNSKRLKNKAILKLHNKPLIVQLVNRLKKSKMISEIVCCTSFLKIDNKIVKLGKKYKFKIFRGSPKDVMHRFIKAAQKYKGDVIVRVTGDNPLTDPKIIDSMVKFHLKKKNDYTFCNLIPVGTRSEIVNLDTLKKCHNMLEDPKSSEYMTWMLNNPKYFKVGQLIKLNKDVKRPEISLTIDYKKDYLNVKKIYEHFNDIIPSLKKIIYWIDTQKKLLINLKQKRKIKKPRFINTNFKKSFKLIE